MWGFGFWGAEGVVVQGQSWVLLGALRLHLLLPADGCDPAAKYGQKRAHLQAKLEDVRLEIEVRLEEEALLSGARTTEAVESLRKTAGMLEKDIERLSGKVQKIVKSYLLGDTHS